MTQEAQEKYIEWLNERIHNLSKIAANETGNEYYDYDGQRRAMIKAKEKFLSLTQSISNDQTRTT